MEELSAKDGANESRLYRTMYYKRMPLRGSLGRHTLRGKIIATVARLLSVDILVFKNHSPITSGLETGYTDFQLVLELSKENTDASNS